MTYKSFNADKVWVVQSAVIHEHYFHKHFSIERNNYFGCYFTIRVNWYIGSDEKKVPFKHLRLFIYLSATLYTMNVSTKFSWHFDDILMNQSELSEREFWTFVLLMSGVNRISMKCLQSAFENLFNFLFSTYWH